MSEAGRDPSMPDLFRQIAEAQDQALRNRVPIERVGTVATKPRPQTRYALPVFALLLGVAGILVGVRSFVPKPQPLAFNVGADRQTGLSGAAISAPADADLPLQFSDGSKVSFGPGAQGRVAQLTDQGATFILERGHLEADIRHADRTRWLFHVGPFRIRVTGTRFAVNWDVKTQDMIVVLREGSVMVERGDHGPGFPVRAGETLRATATGIIGVEPSALPGPPLRVDQIKPAPPVVVAAAPKPSDGPSWVQLGESGDYRSALQAAEKHGFDRLCRRLEARHLLNLGDIARYAGSSARARQAFQCVVDRFPSDVSVADAAFSLGRLAFDDRQMTEAATWFELYRKRWPQGPLADQALGRLIESHLEAGALSLARESARLYLERYPGGSHTQVARRLSTSPP